MTRRRLPRWLVTAILPPVLFVAVCAFICLLPVILPLLALTQAIDERRKRMAASGQDCVICGARLGTAAITLGDAAWRAQMAAEPYQGGYRRIVRRLHALCPGCGAHYEWQPDRRCFTITPVGEPATAVLDPTAAPQME